MRLAGQRLGYFRRSGIIQLHFIKAGIFLPFVFTSGLISTNFCKKSTKSDRLWHREYKRKGLGFPKPFIFRIKRVRIIRQDAL